MRKTKKKYARRRKGTKKRSARSAGRSSSKPSRRGKPRNKHPKLPLKSRGTQTFWIPQKPPSFNDLTDNHWTADRHKKNWYALVLAACIKSAIAPYEKPVHVHVDCYEPDRRRDVSNVVSGAIKATEDGMVEHAYLVDDSPRYVVRISGEVYYGLRDANDDKVVGVRVTIMEVE